MSQQISRRRFLQATSGVVGIGLLAACVPAQAPAAGGATEAGAAGGAISVAQDTPLWILTKADFHPDYNDYIRKHIEEFAAEKGYPIEIADIAGFSAGGAAMQKLAAQVAADDSPDMQHDNFSVPQYHQLDLIVPVTDLVTDLIDRYGETGERQRKDQVMDGEWYSVPLHVRSDGGWARKDIWDAAGIDITALRTYDELREACLEVSDPAAEMWGWGMTVNRSGDAQWFVARILHSFGAYWTDESGQTVTIDTPEAVQALEWVVDTYTNPAWEKMLPPGVLSWTDPTNNEAFLGGKLAYTQNGGTVYAKAVVDQVPFVNDIIWDYPKGGPGLLNFFGLGSMHLSVVKGAKNPEAARELIMSFYEEDVLKKIFTTATTYALPAFSKQWDWEEITSVPNSIAQKEGALDPAGWNGLAYPGPATPWIAAITSQNIDTDMIANAISGGMSAAEAVKQAAEASTKIFQEMGAGAK